VFHEEKINLWDGKKITAQLRNIPTYSNKTGASARWKKRDSVLKENSEDEESPMLILSHFSTSHPSPDIIHFA